MRTILLPALLIYGASVYWLLKHFKFKEIWTGESHSSINQNNRLVHFVKRALDILLVIILAILVLWLPVMVVMGVSQSQAPSWGIDIAVFALFEIDLNELPGVTFDGLRHPEISGKTMVNLDTSNLYAWYMFAIFQQISAAVSFYVLILMRAIVMSLMTGMSFDAENSSRIKRIGIIVVAWNVITPFFQYFGWGSVIQQINIASKGIQLYPSFEISALGMLIGLFLLLLAGMMREATAMRDEQQLTI